MKIIFFGNAEFGVPSLERLARSSHQILSVATNPDQPQGRGQILSPSVIKKKALALKFPLLEIADLSNPETLLKLSLLKADLFAVVAYRILPESLFTLPPKGTINLHASLLPRYRGAAPIRWALINGETKTGVTTFFLQKKVDRGDTILQKETEIGTDENYGELHQRLSVLGAETLLETIDKIERGKVSPVPQDSSLATSAPKITKELGRMNWSLPAQRIFNLVRALAPYPGAFTLHQGKMLKVLQSQVVGSSNADTAPGTITEADPKVGLTVQTGEGRLQILSLQMEGKKAMPAGEFLRGYALEAGTRFESQ